MKSKNHRRVAALAAAGVLLVACGDEADDGVPATAGISPSSTARSNDDTEAVDPPMPTTSEAVPAADPPVATDGAPEPAATDAPAGTDPPAETPAVTEQPVVQPAALGGRALTEALTAESDIETNMLPDLIVDDVGRQAKINLRNVFPADRPVLFWMYAPH